MSDFYSRLIDERAKQIICSNRRTGEQLKNEISKFGKELKRTNDGISKQQDFLVGKTILPRLIKKPGEQESNVNWNRDPVFLQEKASFTIKQRYLDNTLRWKIDNFISGPRNDMKTTSNAKAKKNSYKKDPIVKSKAKTYWELIRVNLRYLLQLNQQSLTVVSEFEANYKKLESCRYIRYSRRQMDERKKSIVMERTCYCNICILNMIEKKNNECDKSSYSWATNSSSIQYTMKGR